MSTTPVTRLVAVVGLALLTAASLRAQAEIEPEPDVRPTTTLATGDRGGKIFGRIPDPKKIRHYYVAAEPEQWDYAPSGRDAVMGSALPKAFQAEPRNAKLRYVQYRDATFTAKLMATPSLGILGPVLRGVVGEYLAVTFLNRTSQPLSMHPHGVHYDKDSEGSYDRLAPGHGAAIAPGATFTYLWELDEKSGPLPTEPSSKGWLYHSHVRSDDEINLGLIGFIIVTDPARARPDGTPADIDREFGALFMTFDESGLGEEAKEAAEYANLPGAASAPLTWTQVQALVATGARPAINGRSFGNLSGLEMNEGERVRWYLFGLGDERDLHTAEWSGLRVQHDGRHTAAVELLPASMTVADLVADQPGNWLLQCRVAGHARDGMFAPLIIYPRNAASADRTASRAFLGLPEAAQSLRVVKAEAQITATSATISLEGEVTVFEAFSVFNRTIQLQLGDRTATFHPDARGDATDGGASLRIKNAGPVGVIYGGVLQFGVTLTGADWLAALRSLGLAASTRELNPPLTLRIGSAEHHAVAQITIR